MDGWESIYSVQRRPVSSCRTLLISGYTSAVRSPFRSDAVGAAQSEGSLPPLPPGSLVVKGATANPGPHLSDETYGKLRAASPRLRYLCPRLRCYTTLRSVHAASQRCARALSGTRTTCSGAGGAGRGHPGKTNRERCRFLGFREKPSSVKTQNEEH